MSQILQTICLNMIVKNESHIIEKTLENLCSYFDFKYWVISDTGSTDNTKELIKSFFEKKKIAGELVEHEWRDFGYNRTKALEAAFNKSDYLLIFDADDKIFGNFKLPEQLTFDQYKLTFGKTFTYDRVLLINNRKKWRFVGVLHEYIEIILPYKVNGEQKIEGDYYLESGRTGNRSSNPKKYINDANILRKAFHKTIKTDYALGCRYAFYCAQSYKDSGAEYTSDAIDWYKKCLELGNWTQEKYYACIMIGDLYAKDNNMKNAIKYWLKTIEYDSDRIEGIVNATTYLRNIGEHKQVNELYHKYKKYDRKLQGKLFLFQDKYDNYDLEFDNSISAFYVNDKQSGYDCCKKILLSRSSTNNVFQSLSNILFYKDLLQSDKSTLVLFYAIDHVMSKLAQSNAKLIMNTELFTIWNTLFEKNRNNLVRDSIISSVNINNPNVIITFTTCKRFDLFQQTVNSILNHWLDVDKIDYWFCVDDNSNNEDRKKMQ